MVFPNNNAKENAIIIMIVTFNATKIDLITSKNSKKVLSQIRYKGSNIHNGGWFSPKQ